LVKGKAIERSFSDDTNAFSRNGDVVFTLPPNVAKFSLKRQGTLLDSRPDCLQETMVLTAVLCLTRTSPLRKEPVLNAAKENASEVSTRVAVPEFCFQACDLQPPSVSSLVAAYDVERPAFSAGSDLAGKTVLSEKRFRLTTAETD